MITIIAGTNRQGSFTLKLANYYQRLLADLGTDARVLSLTSLPPNLIDTDLYGKRSPGFAALLEQVNASSKLVIIAPEYNGSFPGVLKTFIDCCDFPESFYDKKVALVGLSNGKYGNIRGIEHLAGVCHYLGLHILPLRLHLTYIKKEFNNGDELTDPDTIKFVRQQAEKFIGF